MTPYIDDQDFTLYVGDVLEVLAGLPAESVHCCVTSPPYWGLRDYGTGSWEGGDDGCDHLGEPFRTKAKLNENWGAGFSDVKNAEGRQPMGQVCGKCGARRVDHQLGLEKSPEEYVTNMVNVFREVRRVLRRDGTCWLNIGDSYTSGDFTRQGKPRNVPQLPNDWEGTELGDRGRAGHARAIKRDLGGLKPKDLVGIPWLLARSLQEPYYTGRIPRERDRVWLAATIDAEGTICGFSHERKDDGRTRTGLMFNITNSSPALLEEAVRIWPSALHRHLRNSAGHLGKRDVWRWHVNGIENKTALVRELYPYLIVKRAQALLAYNLLLLMADAKRLGHSSQRDAIREKRALLVRLLSDANQGRAFDVPSWCVTPPSLHEQGWYLRSDIIWSKPNPMPESVTDRPTKAHEYLFLLTRSPRYFYDADAIREKYQDTTREVPVAGLNSGAYSPPGQSPHGNARGPDGRKVTRVVGADGSIQHRDGERWPNGGRNKRSVWEIATEPYPDAHFATFPQALVEPCVLAGTSERGCCPVCGAPWERETERGVGPREVAPNKGHLGAFGERAANMTRDGFVPNREKQIETIGWRPTCDHYALDWVGPDGERTPLRPVPCTVLDPFVGSGTTALVARRHGRRSIGIELNAEYAKLAATRLQQLSLLAEPA